ncbi:methyltransferase domain-containing protein [Actinopolymorpha pittospori]|uniref:Spore maturation protein CgeB/SAM-dependent methyltransferase n=1 Tax=Actinopolymorpha pittospori TaxID=648752 RepID=A0A927RIE9_9ACTN|nr:methyltransferase domain-containing protein [Actinopolymorpha pittospori]MBE1604473.1 spore maturation protein CgeB/SAM-dependent methyltransferase [Actinopolymorpha pittospori]
MKSLVDPSGIPPDAAPGKHLWTMPTARGARERIEWLVGQARGDVLDVGCGQGGVSILCARRGLRAVGVDIDPSRIEQALATRVREPDPVRNLLSFRVADATALDLPDATFDCVVMADTIEHVENASSLLAEGARLLRADGVLVLTATFGFVPRDHPVTFYVASLLELLARHMTIQSLDIVDGYFRVVARPGPTSIEDRLRLDADLQPAFEAALLDAQRKAHNERAAMETRLREEMHRTERSLRQRLREETYRAEHALWQAQSMKARRWWRLGEVFFTAGQHPSAVWRMPRDLGRVLRPVPRPKKPERLLPAAAAKEQPSLDAVNTPRQVPGTGTALSQATSGPLCAVELPTGAGFPDGPVARPDLTVAAILDKFSEAALAYEWNQVQPGPQDWQEMLEATRPDLLFVESAWWGNAGRWRAIVTAAGAPKQQLCDLVAWCRQRSIPTVFWNKEDPSHFNKFIETAKLFDHVFTVDADSVPHYREVLGHDRIGLLHFGAQPRVHNPVSVPGGRKYPVAFAGTYYTHKHRERVVQMDTVLAPAREFGLHIFNRIHDNPVYRFPAAYADHVVGTLPYEQMLTAYKAYKVFLNVNSVTGSPTMCARRVFELSACATPVVSGHSRALEEVFGDLVQLSQSPADTTTALKELLGDDETRDRRGHLAMREVFTKHTYGHRVDTVLGALGRPTTRPEPTVSVILSTCRPEQLTHAIEQVAQQVHRPLQLVMVLHGIGIEPEVVQDKARAAGIHDVVVRAADAGLSLGACLNLGIEAADGRYLAKMDDDNLYGEHYLADLLHAFSYTSAGVVGKGAHYVQLQASGVTILRFDHLEHTRSKRVQGGTIVAEGDLLRQLRFADLPRGVDSDLLRRVRAEQAEIYSADRFNFVSVRRDDPSTHTWKISDDELMATGRVVCHADEANQVLF